MGFPLALQACLLPNTLHKLFLIVRWPCLCYNLETRASLFDVYINREGGSIK